jgi:hypothetical protein
MDPPDAIGLKYGDYDDKRSTEEYLIWLEYIMRLATNVADITWISYNAKWTFDMGSFVTKLVADKQLLAKACVQTFTFGQHNQHDLGNNHRPLVRLMHPGVELYPDAIRVPSWRQEHGDKRADTRGRVPGDVIQQEKCLRDTLPLPTWEAKDIERFLSKINRLSETDCWEWTGCKRGGYGRFRIGGRRGKLYVATRLMWRLIHGTDPVGQLILHTCDNPSCCNPNHLFIGSDADNNRDKESKGRGKHPNGSANGLSKLTDSQVIKIYTSAESSMDLARKYGVTGPAIDAIRKGKTWQHITNELNLSDVFNIPRVTGNSHQRRAWHPTQLNEGLVERCIKLSCGTQDAVIDACSGTGTVMRVCKRLNVGCMSIEVDRNYCEHIAEENGLVQVKDNLWEDV